MAIKYYSRKCDECNKGMEEVWYGMTRWSIDDVKCLAPEWTDEQCHEFMERHDRHFEDRMIELGWEVLDLYVSQEMDNKVEEVENGES